MVHDNLPLRHRPRSPPPEKENPHLNTAEREQKFPLHHHEARATPRPALRLPYTPAVGQQRVAERCDEAHRHRTQDSQHREGGPLAQKKAEFFLST